MKYKSTSDISNDMVSFLKDFGRNEYNKKNFSYQTTWGQAALALVRASAVCTPPITAR